MSTLLLTKKRIALEQSELLMEERFESGEMNTEKWMTLGAASWRIRNNALEGKWVKNEARKHGQMFTRQAFKGDVLLEFEAESVPPCDHDIIWWWKVVMNADSSKWESGYLGALGGWWSNKAGLERVSKPELCAMTPLFRLEPGRKYLIQSGSVGGHCFIFANGKLVMELFDPQPHDPEVPGRIGFGVFQSHVRIRHLKAYQTKWSRLHESYERAPTSTEP